MGFGFNLFFAFFFVPLLVIFLILSLIFGQIFSWKQLRYIGLGITGLVCCLLTLNWLRSATVLSKQDYYGSYVINREYFRGKQTDWQYNTFRFEIKDNDSIYFYYTDKERILQTFKGAITTTDAYKSARLAIKMEQPGHHIFSTDPTIYRSSWNFYLVFNSPKFNNVFFKKGKWKPID